MMNHAERRRQHKRLVRAYCAGAINRLELAMGLVRLLLATEQVNRAKWLLERMPLD